MGRRNHSREDKKDMIQTLQVFPPAPDCSYPPGKPDWLIVLRESVLWGLFSQDHCYFRVHLVGGSTRWTDERGKLPPWKVKDHLDSLVNNAELAEKLCGSK